MVKLGLPTDIVKSLARDLHNQANYLLYYPNITEQRM